MRVRVSTGIWAGIPVMLVVLATLDALKPTNIPGLPQVPLVTLWGLPLDLFARDLLMALTLGSLVVGGILVPGVSPRMMQLASLFAGAWWFSVILQIPLTVSEVLAFPITDSFNVTIIWSLLSQTTLGQVIFTQLILVGCVAVLAWVTRGRRGVWILLALAGAAAFAPGFSGHSSMGSGHEIATISLGLHLITMSVWVGGLLALVALVTIDVTSAEQAVRRFSTVALISVLVLAETGLLNAAARVESMVEIVTSQYGAIILAKSMVLVVLAGFGWRHRVLLREVAAGTARPGSGAYFLRLIAYEVVWMSCAIGLAVALSRTAAPGGIPGDVVAPGVVVILGAALPVWIALFFDRRISSLRLVRALASYPEAVMAAMLVVIVLSAMALPISGVLAAVGCAVIAVAGMIAVGVAWTARSVIAVGLAMVIWPIMMWWLMRGTPGETAAGTWVVVLLAEGILVLLAFRMRQPTHTGQMSEKVAA